MLDTLEQVNAAIEEEGPAVFGCLSSLGRRAVFPPDIPFQAEQAKDKAFNATIGQITDGAGKGLVLPSLASALSGLDAQQRNRALLYSPVAGLPDLRSAWRDRQRRVADETKPSALPIAVAGLTHGLSLLADLFAQEGTPVAVPSPFWGNYRQTFALRRGARIATAPAYVEGRFNPQAIVQALSGQEEGKPALAILNMPSNPGGYSASSAERQELLESLRQEAERRPLMVICDDAYAGLVYDPAIPSHSLFWDLIGLHERLVPVKVDGGTKEFDFFGGRIGFVTFACSPESSLAQALESKAKCLLRATLGSPVAVSQMLLLRALESPTVEDEIAAVRTILAARCRKLSQSLQGVPRDLLNPLPFNSGCFALLELPQALGISAAQVREHLLERQDTGVISIAPNFLRIAFCSVQEAALPELVARLEAGVRELALKSGQSA